MSGHPHARGRGIRSPVGTTTCVAARGLAPLRLVDHSAPTSAWVLGGEGEPGASLEADGYQLFRAISGRRRLEDVRSWSWRDDPAPYLPLISPYPQS